MKSGWVPLSLQLFLKLIIYSQLCQESINQFIVKVAKPRIAIPPISVGISLDVFESKWLANEMFRLGFFISYDEVV